MVPERTDPPPSITLYSSSASSTVYSTARRTIIIGDVHGCVDELQDILRACDVDWADDRVYLVGDLVAKGPDSQAVVQLARERGMAAVLGNHDAKVLTYAPDAHGEISASSGKKHLHAAVARSLRPEDWRYLQAVPLIRELSELSTIVVHAGLVPRVPLDEQPRDLVTNMRSITADGKPSKHVEAGVPWASVWPGPAHVVFGHDAVRGLQQHAFATGLDTGCVYGGALSAIILPERRIVSVPARRAYAPF